MHLLTELDQQLNYFHSPDGIFRIAADTPEMVKEWVELREQSWFECISHIDLETIETLVVMGHSLRADYDILENIVEETVNLKKVVLYIYQGENLKYILKKAEFFKNSEAKLVIKFYDRPASFCLNDMGLC